jgi:hypothetical protein
VKIVHNFFQHFSLLCREPNEGWERFTAASVPMDELLITENDFHSQNFRFDFSSLFSVDPERARRMKRGWEKVLER